MALCVLLLLALCVLLEAVRVDRDSHHFIDDAGRTRIFHGVNAVYKIPPWYPSLDGFDPDNSLSKIDAQNLKGWGFNVVRLGVMWPGVEPAERGNYNSEYLDNIQTIVELLAAQGIFVVLDFHQDLLHRKFCGEGVPDYVYEICKKAQPANTPVFPLPAVNYTYPIDEEGNPTLDACLSSMFATYYMSSEVGAAFQCLYDNEENLWDALAGYWVQVATRFSGFTNVLGYELINEPWVGSNHEMPVELLPHYTERKFLQPLYQHLHKAIRAVDDEKIIFFEGLTIDYWPNGFTETPGGAAYNDRQALAYHIYCPLQNPTKQGEVACDAINDEFFAMRHKDVERLGGGWIMTEFGAAEDIKGDMYALEKSMQMADRFAQSWMYWQFKYYQDITTCTPEGESLYQKDGSVCLHKLQILSRTYPQAVAGSLGPYEFNPLDAHFRMRYSLLGADGVTASSNNDALTSVLYINRELYYPHGAKVEITTHEGNAAVENVSVQCSHVSNLIQLVQAAPAPGTAAVQVDVKISPCLPTSGVCTCR